MRKSSLLLSLAVAIIALMTGCNKEPEGPKCKMCSGEQVVYLDGEEMARQTVSEMQYCDEELSQIEANPEVIVTQEVMGMEQQAITTFTCN